MPDIVIRVPVEGDIEVWCEGHRFNCNPVVFKDKDFQQEGKSPDEIEELFQARIEGEEWQQAY